MLCYYVHCVVLICMHQSVPGPVTGLSAHLGIVELTVSWTPPSEPNGVIIVYEVCTNSSGVFSYTNTSATKHTLRNLPPNTLVTFSVRGYTIIGPGEYVTGQASTAAIVREYHFFIKIIIMACFILPLKYNINKLMCPFLANYASFCCSSIIIFCLFLIMVHVYITTILLKFKFEWWQCYITKLSRLAS